MSDKLIIGQYYETSSVLHRADPRVKLVLSFVFMAAIFVAPSWWGLAVMALFTFAMVILSRVPLRVVLRSIAPLLFILVFAVLINLFFTKEGTVFWHAGIITITDVGVYHATFYPCRMALLLLGMTLVMLTTTPIALTDAMESLLRPLERLRFPSHELAMMLGIALRFLPVFIDELGKIRRAQESRGADFGSGGLIKRSKALIPLMVPLFLSAFRHAENLATAMESRCYHGGPGRTRMNELVLVRADYLAVALFVMLMAIVVVMRVLL